MCAWPLPIDYGKAIPGLVQVYRVDPMGSVTHLFTEVSTALLWLDDKARMACRRSKSGPLDKNDADRFSSMYLTNLPGMRHDGQ